MQIPKVFEGFDYWNGKIYGHRIYLCTTVDNIVKTSKKVVLTKDQLQEVINWKKEIEAIEIGSCFVCGGDTDPCLVGNITTKDFNYVSLCEDCRAKIAESGAITSTPPVKSGMCPHRYKPYRHHKFLFLSSEED